MQGSVRFPRLEERGLCMRRQRAEARCSHRLRAEGHRGNEDGQRPQDEARIHFADDCAILWGSRVPHARLPFFRSLFSLSCTQEPD
jgi:hypothetical protein